jgi:hypothetical protein
VWGEPEEVDWICAMMSGVVSEVGNQ